MELRRHDRGRASQSQKMVYVGGYKNCFFFSYFSVEVDHVNVHCFPSTFFCICVCVYLCVVSHVLQQLSGQMCISPPPPCFSNQGMCLRKWQHFINKVWSNNTHSHTYTHAHTTSSCDVNLPMGSIGFNKKGIQHMSKEYAYTQTHKDSHTHCIVQQSASYRGKYPTSVKIIHLCSSCKHTHSNRDCL